MKKVLIISILSIFFLLPFAPIKASGGDFSFRSTVLGANVQNTHGFVYEISNQKYNEYLKVAAKVAGINEIFTKTVSTPPKSMISQEILTYPPTF